MAIYDLVSILVGYQSANVVWHCGLAIVSLSAIFGTICSLYVSFKCQVNPLWGFFYYFNVILVIRILLFENEHSLIPAIKNEFPLILIVSYLVVIIMLGYQAKLTELSKEPQIEDNVSKDIYEGARIVTCVVCFVV